MQIFHWLFKAADEAGGQNTTSKDQEDKPKDLVPCKNNNNNRRSKSKKFKPVIFLCNKDIAKACFYSTIYLKKVDNSRTTHHHHQQQQQPHSQTIMKMPKEGFVVVTHKSDSSKVSPLSEAQVAVSSANAYDHRQCSSSNEKKDKKPKTMSRMKELLRWSASAKSEKGAKLSKKVDGRRLSISESPKISLRWELEKCSTISSVISGVSMASSSRNDESSCKLVSLNSTVMHGLNHCSSGGENWITTDSEFVVLEL